MHRISEHTTTAVSLPTALPLMILEALAHVTCLTHVDDGPLLAHPVLHDVEASPSLELARRREGASEGVSPSIECHGLIPGSDLQDEGRQLASRRAFVYAGRRLATLAARSVFPPGSRIPCRPPIRARPRLEVSYQPVSPTPVLASRPLHRKPERLRRGT